MALTAFAFLVFPEKVMRANQRMTPTQQSRCPWVLYECKCRVL